MLPGYWAIWLSGYWALWLYGYKALWLVGYVAIGLYVYWSIWLLGYMASELYGPPVNSYSWKSLAKTRSFIIFREIVSELGPTQNKKPICYTLFSNEYFLNVGRGVAAFLGRLIGS